MIPVEKYDICEEDLIDILIRTSKNYYGAVEYMFLTIIWIK